MNCRLLIVEDDASLAGVVEDYFRSLGYATSWAADGEALRALPDLAAYDLVLLDLNLPDLDGLDWLEEWSLHRRMPLFVVTGRSDEHSRLKALELGADDYICKPFSVRELELRVRNCVARWRQPAAADKGMLGLGSWRLEVGGRCAKGPEGEQVQLTPGEMAILACLAAAAGEAVPRDKLLDALAPVASGLSLESLNVLIYRLRRKLGKGAPAIHTVPRFGYRLVLPAAP